MSKRLLFYEKGSRYFFLINIFIYILNGTLLKKIIPIEIIGYFFFLSLGIFIGVQCCVSQIRINNTNKNLN
jgi:hypothetical protein